MVPVWLLGIALLTLGCGGCTSESPAARGAVVIEWSATHDVERSDATLGDPIGDAQVSEHTLVYKPGKAKLVERTGGIATLTIRVEHGPTKLEGPKGYAPSVLVPRHLEVTVDDGAGWTIAGRCHPLSGMPLSVSQGDANTPLRVDCALNFDFGWNQRLLPFDVYGDGRVEMRPIDDQTELTPH